MNLQFDPRVNLTSEWYEVPGYKAPIHVLESPNPENAGEDFKKNTFSNYYGRPPIILVHGMVVASSYMRKFGELLAPWFKVYIPDQPGFGRSAAALDSSQTATIPDMATFLHEFVKTIKADKVILIGNSLGCQIIVDFAIRFPKLLDRIVLQGPTVDSSKRSLQGNLAAFALNGTHEPVSMFLIMLQDYWAAGFRRALETIREGGRYSIEEKMCKLQVPTLFLSGEFDPIAPIDWCMHLKNLTPNAVFFPLRKTPHTANYAASDRMSRIVYRYLLSRDDQMIQESGDDILKDFKNHKGRSESVIWNVFVLAITPLLFMFGVFKFLIITLLSYVPYVGDGIDNPEEEEIYTHIPYVADFDSASAMMRATSRALHYRDFPLLGVGLSSAKYAPLVNFFPRFFRSWMYAAFGAMEATNEKKLGEVDCEEMAKAVTQHYPAAQYPVIAIGSSCGALTHIYAAAGIPWLPQTLLMAVHRPPKAAIRQGQIDMTLEMEWGKTVAKEFLEKNPDIQLHHMADANQDQLMVERMAYFRLKRRALGKHYSEFLLANLRKGGKIVIVDCKLSWSVVKVADRHYFQPGAVGGLTAEEYVSGTDKTAKFIASQTSFARKFWDRIRGVPPRKDWRAPTPTGTAPEAEWGFEESLGVDIENFAKQNGFHVQRLVCDYPEDLSPLVADYFQQWYKSLNHIPRQLIVENFIMIDPYWTVRLGLVPFWGLFPIQKSAFALKKYMHDCEKREIEFSNGYLMLFCSGVNSVGFAGISDWRSAIGIPSKLIGVDENKFPADFGYPAKFNKDLKNLTKSLRPIPMPPVMDYKHFMNFVQKNSDQYGVCLFDK